MKKILSLALALVLMMGLMGGAAQAVGESNFPKAAAVRNVTMTLSSIDLYDYAGAPSGGAYIFRPSVTGRFSYLIQGEGDFVAYLFKLNSKNVITGSPQKLSSTGGVISFNTKMKQSTRYMLVVGSAITLATNGRVQTVTAPEGTVQVQVMYDYRGHAFTRPYTLSLEKTAKERIRTAYQSEFYKFTAPYDGIYTLKAGGGNIWLRVLDYKGKLVTEARQLDMKKGSTCYIRLNRVEKKTGAYTLSISLTEPKEEIPVTKVTLNTKKKTINDGKTTTLKAKLAPTYASEKEIKWESSNPDIATVSDAGVVKGMKPGKATITATAKSGAKASCAITVKKVKVTSVSLSKKKLTIKAGETAELSSKIKPSNATNQNVKWTSSKPSVVAVDGEGKLTALKAGKATITVTTSDGKKKAKCTVTVKKAS